MARHPEQDAWRSLAESFGLVEQESRRYRYHEAAQAFMPHADFNDAQQAVGVAADADDGHDDGDEPEPTVADDALLTGAEYHSKKNTKQKNQNPEAGLRAAPLRFRFAVWNVMCVLSARACPRGARGHTPRVGARAQERVCARVCA